MLQMQGEDIAAANQSDETGDSTDAAVVAESGDFLSGIKVCRLDADGDDQPPVTGGKKATTSCGVRG